MEEAVFATREQTRELTRATISALNWKHPVALTPVQIHQSFTPELAQKYGVEEVGYELERQKHQGRVVVEHGSNKWSLAEKGLKI